MSEKDLKEQGSGGRAGPAGLSGLAGVSRETQERLECYVGLLKRWQRVQNLVSRGTLEAVWTRHIADSAQLLPLAQGQIEACIDHKGEVNWADLGTGAGLPGLVVAILLRDTAPQVHLHLVEANQRKVAFLRAAVRELDLRVVIHSHRIEALTKTHTKAFDLVTARALASLSTLLTLSAPLLAEGGCCLFHKGRDFQQEIRDAGRAFEMTVLEKPSMTAEDSRLLVISHIEEKSSSG